MKTRQERKRREVPGLLHSGEKNKGLIRRFTGPIRPSVKICAHFLSSNKRQLQRSESHLMKPFSCLIRP